MVGEAEEDVVDAGEVDAVAEADALGVNVAEDEAVALAVRVWVPAAEVVGAAVPAAVNEDEGEELLVALTDDDHELEALEVKCREGCRGGRGG